MNRLIPLDTLSDDRTRLAVEAMGLLSQARREIGSNVIGRKVCTPQLVQAIRDLHAAGILHAEIVEPEFGGSEWDVTVHFRPLRNRTTHDGAPNE